MNKQAGFTIIELVVVIALLGILSAVALPRFIDVTDDANAAAVEGTAGALQAGVALVKAQAVVDGVTAGNTVNFDGVNVTVNSSRFPTDTSTNAITNGSGDDSIGSDADQCIAVWNGVLQGGRPNVADAAGDGVDYVASASSGECTFTYNTTIGTNTDEPTITYDPEDGSVTTANID